MHFIEREDYTDPEVRAARYPWGTPPPKIDEALIKETVIFLSEKEASNFIHYQRQKTKLFFFPPRG